MPQVQHDVLGQTSSEKRGGGGTCARSSSRSGTGGRAVAHGEPSPRPDGDVGGRSLRCACDASAWVWRHARRPWHSHRTIPSGVAPRQLDPPGGANAASPAHADASCADGPTTNGPTTDGPGAVSGTDGDGAVSGGACATGEPVPASVEHHGLSTRARRAHRTVPGCCCADDGAVSRGRSCAHRAVSRHGQRRLHPACAAKRTRGIPADARGLSGTVDWGRGRSLLGASSARRRPLRPAPCAPQARGHQPNHQDRWV